jgi:hypothetical protein
LADWHPIMAAREPTPGVWELVAQWERVYGRVRIIRRGGEVGYRAETETGEPISYHRTLRGACAAVHQRDLSRGVPELPETMNPTPGR